MPKIPWYTTMAETWQPGEAGARKRLSRFLKRGLAQYRTARELPAEHGTSRLSPHLHFGEIGPRQIWPALGAKGRSSTFRHELVWREFAHHLLFHFRTGIPLVDAGMRELWATGVMHNRVRMVVGSLLVKNLMQPWQDGARWFRDTLVDADLAASRAAALEAYQSLRQRDT